MLDEKPVKVDVIWSDDDLHDQGLRKDGQSALERGVHESRQFLKFQINVVATTTELSSAEVGKLLARHWPYPEAGKRGDAYRIWVADLMNTRDGDARAGEGAIWDFFGGKILTATDGVVIASTRAEEFVNELRNKYQTQTVHGAHIPMGRTSTGSYDKLIIAIGDVLDNIRSFVRKESRDSSW